MWKSKKSILIISFVFTAIVCISFYIGLAESNIKNIETSNTNSNAALYSDIKESDWFYSDVNFVSKKGLMNGTNGSMFLPYDKTTRGMIVTILWRLDGAIKETGNTFTDVNKDTYYYDAVAWASNHQIVVGYDDNTTFGANDAATREQMISIIYRYAKYKDYDVSKKSLLNAYVDENKINNYAVDAIKWGHANGIISGVSDTELMPQNFVQRCQSAAILHRFCVKYVGVEDEQKNDTSVTERPAKEESSSPTVETKKPTGSGGGSGSSNVQKATSTPSYDVTDKPTDNIPEGNTNPTLAVSNIEAQAGESAQVNINIKNNPGILGMTLIAYYDETYCTLCGAESGDVFKDVLDLTVSKTLGSGSKFTWDGVDLTDEQIKDGTALVLNFKIADNASPGNIPITIKCYEGDAFDRNLNSIPLQITNGNITVKTN